MVRYIFASHYRMADGLKETVEFLTSVKENLLIKSLFHIWVKMYSLLQA